MFVSIGLVDFTTQRKLVSFEALKIHDYEFYWDLSMKTIKRNQKLLVFVMSMILFLPFWNYWSIINEFFTLILIFIMVMVLRKHSILLTGPFLSTGDSFWWVIHLHSDYSELWLCHFTSMENISLVLETWKILVPKVENITRSTFRYETVRKFAFGPFVTAFFRNGWWRIWPNLPTHFG